VQKAEKASADPRVAKSLAEAGLRAVVNDSGNYVLLFALDNDRSQQVFIQSSTSQWGTMEIRNVFAFAYVSKTRLSQAKLEKLLKANAHLKSGAWELIEGKEWLAVLSVKVAADCDGEALKTVVRGAAAEADEVELDFTGKDDH